MCVVQSRIKCQDATPSAVKAFPVPGDTCFVDSVWLCLPNPRGGHSTLESLTEGLNVSVTVAWLPESGLLSSVSCRTKRKS